MRIKAPLLLTAVLCILLYACTPAVQPTAEPNDPLVIGSGIYEPYFYLDENGSFAGIDIEIITEACHRLGRTPVFRLIEWQNKDDYLRSGAVDCLCGCFTMNGRESQYDWAGPYMRTRQVVFVSESSGIRQLSDLNGRRIAVQYGSRLESLLLNHQIPQITDLGNVYSLASIEMVFAALKKGYVDACAGNETTFRLYMEQRDGAYRVLDDSLFTAQLGIGFYKGSPDGCAEALTRVLDEMRIDGTIAAILQKYGVEPGFSLSFDAATE